MAVRGRGRGWDRDGRVRHSLHLHQAEVIDDPAGELERLRQSRRKRRLHPVRPSALTLAPRLLELREVRRLKTLELLNLPPTAPLQPTRRAPRPRARVRARRVLPEAVCFFFSRAALRKTALGKILRVGILLGGFAPRRLRRLARRAREALHRLLVHGPGRVFAAPVRLASVARLAAGTPPGRRRRLRLRLRSGWPPPLGRGGGVPDVRHHRPVLRQGLLPPRPPRLQEPAPSSLVHPQPRRFPDPVRPRGFRHGEHGREQPRQRTRARAGGAGDGDASVRQRREDEPRAAQVAHRRARQGGEVRGDDLPPRAVELGLRGEDEQGAEFALSPMGARGARGEAAGARTAPGDDRGEALMELVRA